MKLHENGLNMNLCESGLKIKIGLNMNLCESGLKIKSENGVKVHMVFSYGFKNP